MCNAKKNCFAIHSSIYKICVQPPQNYVFRVIPSVALCMVRNRPLYLDAFPTGYTG